MNCLLLLTFVSISFVSSFQLVPRMRTLKQTSMVRLFPGTDREMGQSIECLRQLAKDPVNGKRARSMINVWEGVLESPSMSFMPPDADSTTRSRVAVKNLLEILANQTVISPNLDRIRDMIEAYVKHNGYSTSGIKQLEELLLEALCSLHRELQSEASSRTTASMKLVAPKMYETVAPSTHESEFSMLPKNLPPQQCLEYLRSTWHLRRQLEESKLEQEIQEILGKSKPLDANDWYCMNPPGYY